MLTFLLIVCVVVLFVRQSQLSNRLKRLESPVFSGDSPIRAAETPESIQHQSIPVPPPPHPHYDQLVAAEPAAVSPRAGVVAVGHTAPVGEEPPVPALEEQDTGDRAVRILNRIGGLAVLIGLAFFYRYAVAQGWVSPWLRVGLGFVLSGLLVTLAEVWHDRYPRLRFGLSGLGLGLWFLSSFAGYSWYHLYGSSVGFVLTLAALGVLGYVANNRRSVGLGALAAVGAYLAPMLYQQHGSSTIVLCFYLGVLLLCAASVSATKKNVSFVAAAWAGTLVNLVVYILAFAAPDQGLGTLPFFAIATLVTGVAVAYVGQNTPEAPGESGALPVLLLCVLMACLLWALVVPSGYDRTDLRNLYTLVASVVAWVVYGVAVRRDQRFVAAAAASGALYLALLFYLNGADLIGGLLVSGSIVAGAGFWFRRGELVASGLTGIYLSVGRTLGMEQPEGGSVVVNLKTVLLLVQSAVLLVASWVQDRVSGTTSITATVLRLCGTVLVWGSIALDLYSRGASSQSNWALLSWLTIFPVFLAAAARKQEPLRVLAWSLAAVPVMVLFFADRAANAPVFLTARFGLQVLSVLVLLALDWASTDESRRGRRTAISGYLWLVLLFEVGTCFSDSRYLMAALASTSLAYVVACLLSAYVWVSARAAVLAAGLFVPSLLFALGAGEESGVAFRLAVTLAAAVVAVAVARAERVAPDLTVVAPYYRGVAAVLAWFGVFRELLSWRAGSSAQQNLGVTIWTAIWAAVLLGVEQLSEKIVYRKVALVLFGAAVVKLFVYDVFALELGYRIVAFTLLGVVLLTVSFVYRRHRDRINSYISGKKSPEEHAN